LREEHLTQAEELAKTGKNRMGLRYLHGLRGEWRLDQGDWALAAESLQEAVSMARAVGQTDPAAEAQLALARFHQGQLTDQRGALPTCGSPSAIKTRPKSTPSQLINGRGQMASLTPTTMN
jgi:hypothetical protein